MPKKPFDEKGGDSDNEKKQEGSISGNITDDLTELIEKSTIQIMTHKIYMHHLKNGLEDNPNDQGWKNQAIFFWSGNEKFERKSLPPEFRKFEKHFFIINKAPKEIMLSRLTAMPWFGMEGNGYKYSFTFNGVEIPLKDLAAKSIIQYIQMPKLTINNASILNDRENYFWLMDTEMIGYENNSFVHKGSPISISKAYELGGLRLGTRNK